MHLEHTSESIWNAYAPELRRFLRRRGFDEATIDDLLQEVFLKIHVGLPTLNDGRKVRRWVYRIAHNVALDHVRAMRPGAALPEALPLPESDPVQQTRASLSVCLVRHLERLPEPYREAIILADLQNTPQLEVARKHGMSLSGAKSRIQRGRERLRKLLNECCDLTFDHRGHLIDYTCQTESHDLCG